MKRQIDPNLDNFENEDLPIDVESAADAENNASESEATAKDSAKATDDTPQKRFEPREKAENGSNANDFKMKEKRYYHSSGHHHHHHSSEHHHSGSHSKKKKKKLPVAAKIAIAFLLIIVILIASVAGTVLYLEIKGKNDLTNVTTQTDYDEKITYKGHDYVYNDDIVTIAFIGVDKRDLGLEDGEIGTAGQADANIVAAVDTSTGKVTAIAVPRDTMVEVDLYSQSDLYLRSETMQLCLSYAYGDGKETSAENVITSLSRILYNIPINKYYALDLNGINPINDAVGGVTLESLFDFDEYGIKKGDKIHVGVDLPAESYVRTRDMDTINASLNRTQRQVQYIKAFAAQLAPAVIDNFSIVSELYNTAADYSNTNISISDATYLASLLISKNTLDFDTVTLEGEMKASDKEEYADVVYAEFYPDEDKLMQTVLDTFYTQIN